MHSCLFVTLAANGPATTYMVANGWLKAPQVPQIPQYIFWYAFGAQDSLIGAAQDSGFLFGSLLLP